MSGHEPGLTRGHIVTTFSVFCGCGNWTGNYVVKRVATDQARREGWTCSRKWSWTCPECVKFRKGAKP